MKVLQIIVPEPEGSVGGADTHVLELCRSLPAVTDVELAVVTALSRTYRSRLADSGVTVYFSATAAIFNLTRLTMKALKDFKPDIIHVHGYESTWAGVLARLIGRSSTPMVVTVHGWLSNSLKVKFMSGIDKLVSKFAKASMIVVTRSTLGEVVSDFRKAASVTYIPNGATVPPPLTKTEARRELGISEKVIVIGAVSRFSPEKRPLLFVEACAEWALDSTGIEFVYLGGGPLLAQAQQLAAQRGIADRVHFLPVRQNPQDVMAAFDILVQTSSTETTSRVVVEGMHLGLPILVSSAGGIGDLLITGEEALTYDKDDFDQLVDSGKVLIRSALHRQLLSDAALRTAASFFSGDAMARSTYSVYANRLNPSRFDPQVWTASQAQERKE